MNSGCKSYGADSRPHFSFYRDLTKVRHCQWQREKGKKNTTGDWVIAFVYLSHGITKNKANDDSRVRRKICLFPFKCQSKFFPSNSADKVFWKQQVN